ncbi:hypothetical protein MNBD_CHLOROFLEXI01-169, partial [hydrothermal vent metagenome]
MDAGELGEIYNGFLLLPDGVIAYDFVQPPKRGTPIVCGTGIGRGGPEPEVTTVVVEDADSLETLTDIPFYTISPLPRGMR